MSDTQTILNEDPVVLILAGQSQATEEDLATEARQALIRSTSHPYEADLSKQLGFKPLKSVVKAIHAQRVLKRALEALKPKSNETSITQ